MKKRTAQLPPTKVLPETKAAFDEVVATLGMTATKARLKAMAVVYGHIKTTHGKLSEVIAREMER